MTLICQGVLFAVNIISSVCVLAFILFGLYEHFMGPEDAKKLLKKLKLPLSYDKVLTIGFISVAVMFISSIMLKKLLGEI